MMLPHNPPPMPDPSNPPKGYVLVRQIDFLGDIVKALKIGRPINGFVLDVEVHGALMATISFPVFKEDAKEIITLMQHYRLMKVEEEATT